MNNSYVERAKKVIADAQVLSVVAARRARQLAQGARPMIKCDSENYVDIALLEIAEGLLSYEFGVVESDAGNTGEEDGESAE